jgi:hypothetical protein
MNFLHEFPTKKMEVQKATANRFPLVSTVAKLGGNSNCACFLWLNPIVHKFAERFNSGLASFNRVQLRFNLKFEG